MVYVRCPPGDPDISSLVHKVRFFLHPSYRPNDLVEVTEAPFHLVRKGWGEFPLRVQLHFRDRWNKPVDVIHNLKVAPLFFCPSNSVSQATAFFFSMLDCVFVWFALVRQDLHGTADTGS